MSLEWEVEAFYELFLSAKSTLTRQWPVVSNEAIYLSGICLISKDEVERRRKLYLIKKKKKKRDRKMYTFDWYRFVKRDLELATIRH